MFHFSIVEYITFFHIFAMNWDWCFIVILLVPQKKIISRNLASVTGNITVAKTYTVSPSNMRFYKSIYRINNNKPRTMPVQT